jgi:hypothetical protein
MFRLKCRQDRQTFLKCIAGKKLILFDAGYNAGAFINKSDLTVDYICDNDADKTGKKLWACPLSARSA